MNGYDAGELLFDPALITTLDWSRHKATFRGDVSPHKPGPNLIMRPLSVDDFDKGMHATEAVAFLPLQRQAELNF